MSYIKNLLMTKIEDYINNQINRYDLYQWAKKIDHQLLFDHKVLEIDYFVISDFINDLRMNPDDECMNDTELNKIIDILKGKRNYNKSYFMLIPPKFVKKDIHNIVSIVNYYKSNHSFSDIYWDDVCDIVIKANNMEILTIPDMIYYNIITLISSLPPEKGTEFYGSTLFIKEEEVPIVSEIIDMIDRLIQIYEGKSKFNAIVFYNKGNSAVSITL